MKKVFLVSFCLLLSLGCVNPLKNFFRAEKKVDGLNEKTEKNKGETIDKAKIYIHGTSSALQLDPFPNQYNKIASDLNKRSELILGPPSLNDGLIMDKIVIGLLSTNEHIRAKSQKDLENKDKEVVLLQEKLKALEGKLESAEKEKDRIAKDNSILASKWHKFITWVKWIFWGGLSIAGFLLISQILSATLPPPYSSVFSILALILGGFGRFLFKIVPSAKGFANVVGKETYLLSELTLKHLVAGLQEIREKEIKPEEVITQSKNIQIKDLIDNILSAVTDSSSREKIIEIKKSINLI